MIKLAGMNSTATTQDTNINISIKEFIRIATWAVKMNFTLVPWYYSFYTGLRVILYNRDLLYSYIFAKVVDQLILIAQTPNGSIFDLTNYILLIIGYNLIVQVLNTLRDLAGNYYNIFIDPKLEMLGIKKMQDLGIQTLEQPEVSNKISRSKSTLTDASDFSGRITDLFIELFRIAVSLSIVSTISPWLVLLLSLTIIPSILVNQKFYKLMWKHRVENTEPQRIAGAASNYLQTVSDLKEIFITHSFKFFENIYTNFIDSYLGKRLKMRQKWTFADAIVSFFDQITLTVGSVVVFTNFIAKKITIGDVTFQIRALSTLQGSLFSLSYIFNTLFDRALRLKDTYELYNMDPAFSDGFLTLPKLKEGPEVNIHNVSFTYPNTTSPVLKNISLKIKPGEKIAFVGHNGAGKTTLVNLICRFYRPTSGKITINNFDLNELQIETWYRNLGTLFQDYNTYPSLTVAQNIHTGQSDKPLDEQKMLEAATNADALKFINQMPKRFNNILSERYEGGIRPSTGQWQKIALARFFYRDAPMIIFDEPTAAIDPVSEYNIFNKIYDFFKGKTVIVISHRFSTVRNADRIFVVDNGEIIEQGTHNELVQKGGKYAEAFKLQAEGYSAVQKIY